MSQTVSYPYQQKKKCFECRYLLKHYNIYPKMRKFYITYYRCIFLLVPFTQLHGWWHILAGYSSYLHVIFCLHHRQIFLQEKTTLKCQPWIGITIERVDTKKFSQSDKLSFRSEPFTTVDDAKNK